MSETEYTELRVKASGLKAGDYITGSRKTVVSSEPAGIYTGKQVVTVRCPDGSIKSALWQQTTSMKIQRPIKKEVVA